MTDRLRCSSCNKKRWRERNPAHYTYDNLRTNAKRRGIDFQLSLEDFKEFCSQTGYLNGKGPNANDLTIDRIDPRKGYQIDNIRVMTRSANSKKKWIDDYYLNGQGQDYDEYLEKISNLH